MSSNPDFDRWYAAKNVKFVLRPSHELETFGSTLVNYHLVSELLDAPGKIRIREGRLEAHQPLVITPGNAEIRMEGFGEEAKRYMDFLRDAIKDMRILRYGCHLKTDRYSEQIVTDNLDSVVERVANGVRESGDKFAAVLVGVDEPWDIALLELWRHEVDRSAARNIKELQEKGKLF